MSWGRKKKMSISAKVEKTYVDIFEKILGHEIDPQILTGRDLDEHLLRCEAMYGDDGVRSAAFSFFCGHMLWSLNPDLVTLMIPDQPVAIRYYGQPTQAGIILLAWGADDELYRQTGYRRQRGAYFALPTYVTDTGPRLDCLSKLAGTVIPTYEELEELNGNGKGA